MHCTGWIVQWSYVPGTNLCGLSVLFQIHPMLSEVMSVRVPHVALITYYGGMNEGQFMTSRFILSAYSCYRPHLKDGKVMFSQVSVHSHLRGTPVPGSFPGHWSQVISGVPQSWLGEVLHDGAPCWPGQDLGTLQPSSGWGTPPPRTGVPPGQVRMGYPPPHGLDWGNPTGQKNRASTCYAAGGMPLASTQEDFLVMK